MRKMVGICMLDVVDICRKDGFFGREEALYSRGCPVVNVLRSE